jgi:hypothetical protein
MRSKLTRLRAISTEKGLFLRYGFWYLYCFHKRTGTDLHFKHLLGSGRLPVDFLRQNAREKRLISGILFAKRGGHFATVFDISIIFMNVHGSLGRFDISLVTPASQWKLFVAAGEGAEWVPRRNGVLVRLQHFNDSRSVQGPEIARSTAAGSPDWKQRAKFGRQTAVPQFLTFERIKSRRDKGKRKKNALGCR